MTQTQLRFRQEFGAVAGDAHYLAGRTLYEARKAREQQGLRSMLFTTGSIDVSRLTDQREAADAPRSEAARFRAAFGDAGAAWFAEGLTWEQAQLRHAQATTTNAGDQTRKRRGFASRIRMPGSARAAPSSAAAPPSGFAAKFRLPRRA